MRISRTFLLIVVCSSDDFGVFVGLGLHLRLLRGSWVAVEQARGPLVGFGHSGLLEVEVRGSRVVGDQLYCNLVNVPGDIP